MWTCTAGYSWTWKHSHRSAGKSLRTRGPVEPIRITAAGQQFLDAIRDETIWQKLKTSLGEKLGAVPISVLTSLAAGLATEWAKRKLGLK